MNTQRFVYVPYQLVRLPWTTVDQKLMSRLPVDAAPRRAFDLLLGTADSVAGRVLHAPDLQRAGAARRSQTAATPRPAGTRPSPFAAEPGVGSTAMADEPHTELAAEVEAEVEQMEEVAREQVVEDAAVKEREKARSNHTVSTIKQGLRQEEVAAEVRAKRAEDRAAERARNQSD